MNNDQFLQFDSLIDALSEDTLGAEDICKLSPDERQMFLTAKMLKGVASYDPNRAEIFKKQLSETLRTVPIASSAPISVASDGNISSFFEKVREFFTAQKRTFALSFAVLALVFVAVLTNLSQPSTQDTEALRLIADLSGGVDASLQNERELNAAFSSADIDDPEMLDMIELLELSSSLDDFDPDSKDDIDAESDMLDLQNFSHI